MSGDQVPALLRVNAWYCISHVEVKSKIDYDNLRERSLLPTEYTDLTIRGFFLNNIFHYVVI